MNLRDLSYFEIIATTSHIGRRLNRSVVPSQR